MGPDNQSDLLLNNLYCITSYYMHKYHIDNLVIPTQLQHKIHSQCCEKSLDFEQYMYFTNMFVNNYTCF